LQNNKGEKKGGVGLKSWKYFFKNQRRYLQQLHSYCVRLMDVEKKNVKKGSVAPNQQGQGRGPDKRARGGGFETCGGGVSKFGQVGETKKKFTTQGRKGGKNM